MKNYDRAIADYDAAVRLDPKFQRAYNNRGAAWRAKGDRRRALQDYAEAVRLNPSDATAAGNYKEVSLQIERLNGLADQKSLPSFNCAVARLRVEKAICADPGLARLDREMNEAFLKAIASAESRQPSCGTEPDASAAQVHCQKRNAQFGRPGYDLRQAMARAGGPARRDLQTIAFSRRAKLILA